MEQKKKRGRPPGSGKKVLVEPDAKNDLQSQVVAAMEKAGITPLVVTSPEKAKADEVVEFPKDWSAMGKVERLKWLTANKK